MRKKGILSIIYMIVVLVFILVAFFSPWYSSEISSEIDHQHNDFYLTKIVTDSKAMGEQSINYDEFENLLPMESGADTSWVEDFSATFKNTQYLTIGLIITSILALIGVLGCIAGKVNRLRKVGVAFGIITFILAIFIACYFAISLNNTLAEQGFPVNIQGETQVYDMGFWSSINTDEFTISSGPGFAWYLMIVAGIIAALTSVVIYKTSSFVQIVPIEEKGKPSKWITLRALIVLKRYFG